MTNPRLDVEDDDARQRRIQSLLEHANNPAARPTVPSTSFDFRVRETHAIQPPTELLSRLEAFLPQLAASNADLAQRAQADPDSVNIEHIDESADQQYIEMNLGLGVFEMRRPESASSGSVHDSEAETNARDSDSDPEGTTDSDSASDASSPDVISKILSIAPPRSPRPRRTKPGIIVLSEASTNAPNSTSDDH